MPILLLLENYSASVWRFECLYIAGACTFANGEATYVVDTMVGCL